MVTKESPQKVIKMLVTIFESAKICFPTEHYQATDNKLTVLVRDFSATIIYL